MHFLLRFLRLGVAVFQHKLDILDFAIMMSVLNLQI